MSCDDKYVSSVTLENIKDRAITIFAIYLRIGSNYYLEIENFDDTPLILKAFEVYQKEYGEIAFYGINMNRIKIDNLMDDKRVKRRIILSTSNGKYEVPKSLPKWNPVYEYFKNNLTAIIHPVRSMFKDKAFGLNVKYIIVFKYENGKEEIIPIRQHDYELKIFKNFNLTKESVKSKSELEIYLNKVQADGKLNALSFEVHDLEEWRGETYKLDKLETINAEYVSKFQYYIVGRIYTKISDWQLKRQNIKRKQLGLTKR
jgi:hypothetical protein